MQIRLSLELTDCWPNKREGKPVDLFIVFKIFLCGVVSPCLLLLFPWLDFPHSGYFYLGLWLPHIWRWLLTNNVFGVSSWVWCWCWFTEVHPVPVCKIGGLWGFTLELWKLGLMYGYWLLFGSDDCLFDVFGYCMIGNENSTILTKNKKSYLKGTNLFLFFVLLQVVEE